MAARLPSPAKNESAPPEQDSRPGVPLFVWIIGILILAVSLFGNHDQSPDTARTPHAAAAPAPSASASASVAPPTGKHLPRAEPIRLLIPKISVNAPFTNLALSPSGQLQPPAADDVNLVGWHAKGTSPGEAGTAIIAGHVDTATSAAVFADLRELEKGDNFKVKRADGRTASFVVDGVETFEKDNFPDRRVYADTRQAQVRLITCAGDYDHSAKDYTENLVVFAHLV
jgi:LPXTG-site transpeptidase (sortase) family protein